MTRSCSTYLRVRSRRDTSMLRLVEKSKCGLFLLQAQLTLVLPHAHYSKHKIVTTTMTKRRPRREAMRGCCCAGKFEFDGIKKFQTRTTR